MKIIDRYVGSNVVSTAIFGVVVLSFVIVLGNLFKELFDVIINNPDVPIVTVLIFMALVLPFSLTFTIPWGFLTALLLVFGRLSADNELIALRANGVSISRICTPVFLLAVVLTLTCFWINADIAPRALNQMNNAAVDLVTRNPIALFQADEVVDPDKLPDQRIYVGAKEGDNLKNLILFELNDDGEPVKMVHAASGILTSDPKNEQLLLKMTDARFEQHDKKDPRDVRLVRPPITVGEGIFPVSLANFYRKAMGEKPLRAYTLPELGTYVETTDRTLKEKAGQLEKNDGDAALKKEVKELRSDLLQAKVEVNKRLSSSLACLAFAMIAVPLGITAHRKETSVGFALSLVVALTYFLFIIMADTFRDQPAAHPSLLIWVPNVVFITLGAVLYYRLAKK